MIRLAFGVPGAGKTLGLQDIINRDSREKGAFTYFVVDRAAEWEDPVRWRGAVPKLAILDGDNEPDLAELQQMRDEGGWVVLFQHPYEGEEVAEWAQLVGDVVYVDDEIDLVATYTGWLENPLRAFVHRGRHLPDAEGVIREVHVYGAGRRPQNVHTDLTSMADEMMIFRVQGHRTLKRLVDEGVLLDADVVTAQTQADLQYFRWTSRGERGRGELLAYGQKVPQKRAR